LQFKTPAGRADLAFVGRKLAVFVDGCFWHGCPEHYVPPRSSSGFWSRKLRNNVKRDQRQTHLLRDAGWLVLRFWEHEVAEDPEAVASRIERCIRDGNDARGRQPRVVWVEFVDDTGQLERRHLQSLESAEDLGMEVRERSTRKWRRRAEIRSEARGGPS
jgi:DNA mismatch endonuclease (patch repair protein)